MLRTTTKIVAGPFTRLGYSEFSIFLLPVWDESARGKQIGWKLEITGFKWERGHFGNMWRNVAFNIAWQIPYGLDYAAFHRARRLKQIVRRMIAVYGKIPDMHAIAMRLRAL